MIKFKPFLVTIAVLAALFAWATVCFLFPMVCFAIVMTVLLVGVTLTTYRIASKHYQDTSK